MTDDEKMKTFGRMVQCNVEAVNSSARQSCGVDMTPSFDECEQRCFGLTYPKGMPRQCKEKPHTKIGGFPFCRKHAREMRELYEYL